MVSLLDDVSPDAMRLLNILADTWPKADRWPHRQYISHEMAAAGLDLVEVLNELPQWAHGYRAVRPFGDSTTSLPPGAPPELGNRIVPTVYGLVRSGNATANQMVKAFLAGIRVGYAWQMSFVPDPVKVKAVTLENDALIGGIRHQLGPFGEVNGRLIRLLLAGEPPTWLGVGPDPDAVGWAWKLWFGSLRRFAVDTGDDYLAALEELIGSRPEERYSSGPVEPAALPRALDHLDDVWELRAGERLFQRPRFGRAASLGEPAGSADEFYGRCNALYDVFSKLTVPSVAKVEGALNFLKADLGQRMTDPESLERAREAVSELQLVVRLRRGQAHSDAAPDTRRAAAQLGVRLTGDWADSWDRVRRAAIEAIYALIDELEAARG